ncbi:MAG: serine/threonine protein kinase [Myxococcales bacterium]|nr:serine/threonine protein kinase [Myxococcales bacterium]
MSKVLPQHFGKYILMRKIAMGGMAEIFKAKQAGAEGFEKDLVIKRILPHFTEDESFVKMFIDEASITAKLQHPNIVQIFDFDIADGTYYIAMEYIEGQDLKDVLERAIANGETLSVAQCVWILMETGKGLSYAHTKDYRGKPLNIVHRDISPSNVMVGFNGEVKLMDFGIAKAAQRSTKTMAGAVKGKVAYMSPEQARGKPLDGRSDLFALGIMLWEMLTGRRLFLAESDFETLTNVLKTPAPPPSSVNPAIPVDLDPIVLKCLAKDRDERYPTVEAFTRELTRWYYSNVIDLEKEKLKPLMHRLFKGEIDQAEKDNDAERVDMMGRAASNASESTAMMPAAGTNIDGPLSEERTRLDAGPIPGGTAVMPQITETQTQAMPAVRERRPPQRGGATRTSTAAARSGGGSKKGLWIGLLVLLLLGGGAVAVVLALQGGDSKGGGGGGGGETVATGETAATPGETGAGAGGATTAPAKEMASLSVIVEPRDAKVKIDGDLTRAAEVPLGGNARITAEASDYEPYEEVVAVDEKTKVVTITMVAKKLPLAVVIRPSLDDAVVYVDGERLGAGAQTFKGVAGQEIAIRVQPASGEAVTKTVTLSEDAPLIDIALTQAAEVSVFVTPTSAAVEASAGEAAEKEPGQWAVTGLEVGQSVDLTIKAGGYKTVKQTVELKSAEENVRIELEKAALGKGSVRIWAKPWANVSVDGAPHGTAPFTVDGLSAGRHTIVFSQGGRSVTKTVTVQPGRQVSVGVDFTTP